LSCKSIFDFSLKAGVNPAIVEGEDGNRNNYFRRFYQKPEVLIFRKMSLRVSLKGMMHGG